MTEKEIEQAKDLYYALGGWDVAMGNPTVKRLAELGVGWAMG